MFQSMENVETLKSYMETVKDYFTIKNQAFTLDITAIGGLVIHRWGNIVEIDNFNIPAGTYKCTIPYGSSRYVIPFAHLSNAQMDDIFPREAPHANSSNGSSFTIEIPFAKVNIGTEQYSVYGLILLKYNNVWYLSSNTFGSATQNATITTTGYTSFPAMMYLSQVHYPMPDLPTIP